MSLLELIIKLEAIPGVDHATVDDFDSTHANVFVFLEHSKGTGTSKDKTRAFPRHLRSYKADIKRIASVGGLQDFRFLHWPQKEYEFSAGERFDDGYSHSYVKIEVPR